jgi:hypothetical protein
VEVLVDREQDASGDYGYDLAHEAGRQGRPAEPTGDAPRPPLPAESRPEPDGDFAYDEAHDF